MGKHNYDKEPDQSDLAVLSRIAGISLSGPVPSHELPLAAMYHGSRLGPKGFTHVHHLWSDRSLHALAWLWNSCHQETDPLTRLALCFWVEQAFWGLSWQNRYKAIQFGKVGGSAVNNYMIWRLLCSVADCRMRRSLQPRRQ